MANSSRKLSSLIVALPAGLFLSFLTLLAPRVAIALQQAELKANFSPDKLGASTTIHLAFNITPVADSSPMAVTDVQIALPAGMGLGTTDLGEETCSKSALLSRGTEGCSPNSRMGFGNADVEIPVAGESPKIHASITLYMGVPENQHTTLLMYAATTNGVAAQFVFPSEMVPATGLFGAQLQASMPLIPTWPDGPSAVIQHMDTTLGPSHLTYYARKNGKLVPYSPQGMAVPEQCPAGGFPFRARYAFADGSTAQATTRVPCPRRTSPRSKRRVQQLHAHRRNP